MNRRLAFVAVLAPTLALPAVAAENQTTMKVALTDMSSAMGMGPAGKGMMGHSMMHPGQGMMGYGWSGPGQGQTWTSPGPGLMGPGMMMGMMAVRITQPSVKAGAVRFDVTNWSRSMLHEMLVVAVDNPQAPLPYDYSQAKVAEDQVKVGRYRRPSARRILYARRHLHALWAKSVMGSWEPPRLQGWPIA
jgi:hypothetical protein